MTEACDELANFDSSKRLINILRRIDIRKFDGNSHFVPGSELRLAVGCNYTLFFNQLCKCTTRSTIDRYRFPFDSTYGGFAWTSSFYSSFPLVRVLTTIYVDPTRFVHPLFIDTSRRLSIKDGFHRLDDLHIQ